ncbi:MAG: hypothetical protein NTV62_03930, partial [Candidatus Gribaldobacteria bacterium]|nr:hypothetical protein [Candidatus Gribaldobacteria bacterium]
WCHTFNTNLGMGSSGAETNALHSVLSKEVVTGDFGWSGDNFDEQTASYVVGLQEKYASEILNPSGLKHGTGYVGNSTRAKLNKLYGCGNSNNCTADAKQCPDGSYVGRTGSKCEFTACPTTKCLKEGEINSVGYNSSEQSLDCCPGLRFISVPEAWRNPDGSADSTCNPFKFTVPSSVVCTYCGNGVCGTGENSCNCPSDCKTTAVKSVSVISPNGGETFVVGQSYFIKWSAPDTTRVVIDIVGRDGKAFYGYGIPAVLSNNGLYLWQIPANEPLGDYKVRVMNCPASLSEGACANIDLTGYGYDESDNYFRIIQPNTASVKVLSPNGGESFRTGDIVNIKWQSTGIDKVNIYLCNRPLTEVGFCENITTSTGAIFGNYNWVIPADFFAKNPFFSTGNNFRIRVFNYNNDNSSDFKDESDSNFSISGDVPVCLDTDHGINFNIKGLTSGLADGNATALSTSVDYCSNQNTLIEYSCSTFLNRYQTKTTYTCPYGCEDGACINSTTITKIPRNLIAGLNAISFPLKPSNLSFQSFLAPLKDKGILAGFGYYNSSGEWVYYNRDNITGDIDINQVYFLALTANGTINFTGD